MDKSKWEESYLLLRRNEALREKRIKMFGLDKRSCVLELGCGDGLNLRILKKLGYDNIYGLDNSKELLSRISGIQTILADACDTGLPNDFFDVIFVDSMLHHLDDPQACLKEIRRILKDGGYFCFMEPRGSFARKLLDLVTFSALSNIFPLLRNRRISLREEYDVYARWLAIEREFSGQITRNGFEIIFRKNGIIGMFVKSRLRK